MVRVYETSRFVVETGSVTADPEPQYLVRNKETGIVEHANAALYFSRAWAMQMTQALEEQEAEIRGEQEPVKIMSEPSGAVN